MICIDNFSGPAADLKGRHRHYMSVLAVLEKNPRVSTWDMSEERWLRGCIDDLLHQQLIVAQDEPYPWHRWTLTDAGRAVLAARSEK